MSGKLTSSEEGEGGTGEGLTGEGHHGAQGGHQDIPAPPLHHLQAGHAILPAGEGDVGDGEAEDDGDVEGEGEVVEDGAGEGEGEHSGDGQAEEEGVEPAWGGGGGVGLHYTTLQ